MTTHFHYIFYTEDDYGDIVEDRVFSDKKEAMEYYYSFPLITQVTSTIYEDGKPTTVKYIDVKPYREVCYEIFKVLPDGKVKKCKERFPRTQNVVESV